MFSFLPTNFRTQMMTDHLNDDFPWFPQNIGGFMRFPKSWGYPPLRFLDSAGTLLVQKEKHRDGDMASVSKWKKRSTWQITIIELHR